MTDALEMRALQLFSACADMPVTAREAWLAEQCGEDRALYDRVWRLLAADQAMDQGLNTGAALSALDPAPDQIGPYRVDSVIGEGGMGVVYRAERTDGAFERVVAIKLVKSVVSDSAQQRFENERRILARMSHPNIAALLDGGAVQGRPYLVMEFVEGEPLRFDARRSLNQTLCLFIKVCRAVGYAHNKLVLHRDIKPDNVLLDTAGEPKLLDFGVAKIDHALTDVEQDMTGAAPAPMTLTYSAPERILGEPATVAADVYSLGVCLFEVLTGQRPYDLRGLTLGEAYRQAEAQDVAASYTGPVDLQAIIGQATHGDPQRRYLSADALADDLERFVDGFPVLARGDDWRYLLARFVRRYRVPVAAGVAGMVALVAALGVAVAGYVESERQARIAERERDTAAGAVAFLSNAIASTNPWVSGDKEPTLTEILDQALAQLEGGAIADPVARAYMEVALSRVHDGRGDYEQALNLSARAVERLADAPASPLQLAEAYGQHGLNLHNNDRQEDARDALQRSLSELARASQPDLVRQVASRTTLGAVLEELTEVEAAEALYREAIATYETQGLHAPDVFAQTVNNMGRLQHQLGRLADATTYYQRAVDLVRDNPMQHAIALSNLAGVLKDQGRFVESEQAYGQALAQFDSVVGAGHPQAIIARTTLAHMLVEWEKIDQARHTIDAALADAAAGLPEQHFITAYTQNIAAMAWCGGSFDPVGLDYARRSLATRQAILPTGHWSIASGRSVVGYCLMHAGQLSEAGRELDSALQQLLAVRGEGDPMVKVTRTRLSELAARQVEAQASAPGPAEAVIKPE